MLDEGNAQTQNSWSPGHGESFKPETAEWCFTVLTWFIVCIIQSILQLEVLRQNCRAGEREECI